MVVINASLYKHKGKWELNERLLKHNIVDIISNENSQINTLEIYLLQGSTTLYKMGSKNTLYIYIGATPGESDAVDEVLNIGNTTYAMQSFIPKDQSIARPIMDKDNQIVGYYVDEFNEFYIPNEIHDFESDEIFEIIIHAIKTFTKEVVAEFKNINSWMKSPDKDRLREEVIKYLSRDKERTIQALKNDIEYIEDRIKEITRELKNIYDRLIDKKQKLEQEENNSVHGLDNFIKGLDLIAQHPQVSNLIVERDKITVNIDDVYAYADIKGEEKRFYIGNMTVKINIADTDIRFFGDNPRNGYWGQDPHPHVNGSNGYACLGNVAATIAELCAQKEIYPLFLTCLDFLENANTDDPAGKKIVMWDEVDEDGNIIVRGGEQTIGETFYCEHCDEYHDEDAVDRYIVYQSFDRDEESLYDEEVWCENCRSDYASWSDEMDEYVNDHIIEDIRDYFAEKDDEEELF